MDKAMIAATAAEDRDRGTGGASHTHRLARKHTRARRCPPRGNKRPLEPQTWRVTHCLHYANGDCGCGGEKTKDSGG